MRVAERAAKRPPRTIYSELSKSMVSVTPSSDWFAFDSYRTRLPRATMARRKAPNFPCKHFGQSEWSHVMPRLLALVIAASIFGISTAACAAPALERVRGTVKSISETSLVVHTTSGTDETLDLTAKTGYLTVAKSNLNHIDEGGYIWGATKSIGHKLV